MALPGFVLSATQAELRWIAGLDYGTDAERHFAALDDLIFARAGAWRSEDQWFPYEVIELASHWLQPEHEREFVVATLLVIHAIRAGFDRKISLQEKPEEFFGHYVSLPEELSSLVLAEFEAGCQG
jgi:hypothetical protein